MHLTREPGKNSFAFQALLCNFGMFGDVVVGVVGAIGVVFIAPDHDRVVLGRLVLQGRENAIQPHRDWPMLIYGALWQGRGIELETLVEAKIMTKTMANNDANASA